MAAKTPKLPVKTEFFEFPNTVITRLVRGENGSQFDRIRTVFSVSLEPNTTIDARLRYKIEGVVSDVDLVVSLLKDVTHSATILVHKRKYKSKFDLTDQDYQSIKKQLDISVPVLSAHRGQEARDMTAVDQAVLQMRKALGLVNEQTAAGKAPLQPNFATASLPHDENNKAVSKPPERKRKAGKAEFAPINEAQAIASIALTDPDIDVVFLVGDGGGGKTRVAMESGVAAVNGKAYKGLELYKPNQGSGEGPGTLPGGISEKNAPFLSNLSDLLIEVTGRDLVANKATGLVRKAGTPFDMRGATYRDSFVIIDEAQNLTIEQARLLLTRIGSGCKIVITGDISDQQNDLEGHCPGLAYLIASQGSGFNRGINDSRSRMAFVQFSADDSSARHPLLPSIHQNFNDLPPELRQAMLDMEGIDPVVRKATELFMDSARTNMTTAYQITHKRFELLAKLAYPAVFGIPEVENIVPFQPVSAPGRNP